MKARDALGDLSATANFVKEMRYKGCAISIDSGEPGNPVLSLFGPLGLVDYLLINKQWVEPALLSQYHLKILKNLTEYGRQLRLKIIAQGVNNSRLLELVRGLKVDYCQGMVGGKLLLVEDLETRVGLSQK